jgi:hypothetical protein
VKEGGEGRRGKRDDEEKKTNIYFFFTGTLLVIGQVYVF